MVSFVRARAAGDDGARGDVKTYLLSWLKKAHAGAKLVQFERERPGDWLVWEAGPWRPPAAKRETLVAGPQTRLLPSGESLAIQLASRNGSSEVTLGRAPENDLVIDDATLSRTHLVFRRDAGGWTVQDAGSRNGSSLDGASLGATRARIAPGSLLEAGAVRLTFYDAASLFVRLRTGR